MTGCEPRCLPSEWLRRHRVQTTTRRVSGGRCVRSDSCATQAPARRVDEALLPGRAGGGIETGRRRNGRSAGGRVRAEFAMPRSRCRDRMQGSPAAKGARRRFRAAHAHRCQALARKPDRTNPRRRLHPRRGALRGRSGHVRTASSRRGNMPRGGVFVQTENPAERTPVVTSHGAPDGGKREAGEGWRIASHGRTRRWRKLSRRGRSVRRLGDESARESTGHE